MCSSHEHRKCSHPWPACLSPGERCEWDMQQAASWQYPQPTKSNDFILFISRSGNLLCIPAGMISVAIEGGEGRDEETFTVALTMAAAFERMLMTKGNGNFQAAQPQGCFFFNGDVEGTIAEFKERYGITERNWTWLTRQPIVPDIPRPSGAPLPAFVSL